MEKDIIQGSVTLAYRGAASEEDRKQHYTMDINGSSKSTVSNGQQNEIEKDDQRCGNPPAGYVHQRSPSTVVCDSRSRQLTFIRQRSRARLRLPQHPVRNKQDRRPTRRVQRPVRRRLFPRRDTHDADSVAFRRLRADDYQAADRPRRSGDQRRRQSRLPAFD